MSSASALLYPPPPPPPSSWTFTQGLVLGQASFLLLSLLFIRYVVFSPSEPVDTAGWRERRAVRVNKRVLSTNSVPPPVPGQILGKTGYEMATHPAESTDWLNVLFALVIQGYRNDLLSAGGEDGARQRIEKWLNPENGEMSWLDPIEITALSLGNSYPLLSNARIRPADGQGHIRAEIDVDYLDSVSLSLSTAVLINFPRPRFAVLPVSLGVELVALGGTLSLQLHEPMNLSQHLHACLLPDFHLNLKTTSLLGSSAKLQDIPKLEQLIVSRLRAVIHDRFVHPHHLSLALPRILSPSISPTPIITDLGDGAVAAMGEAVKQGLSRMVEDLGSSFEGSHLISSPEARSLELGQPGGATWGPASPPGSPKLTRKIPMPAGFPMSNYASESTTPIHTPGPSTSVSPQMRKLTQASTPSQPNFGTSSINNVRPSFSASSSSYRPDPAAGSVRQDQAGGTGKGTSTATGASIAPSFSNAQGSASQFRFRGQFASPSATPGIGAENRRERQLGALNSRAG